MLTRTLFLLTLCAPAYAGDFNLYFGMSLSDESSTRPEVDLPDPLGILRMEYKTDRENIVFCEHISSLPKIEAGSGLNHCGFLVRL
jgi:hypothetical protein